MISNTFIVQTTFLSVRSMPPSTSDTVRSYPAATIPPRTEYPEDTKTACRLYSGTMASMLYYNGVDSVSISKRLGHAQVSTTSNIYAHVIESADRKNAEILSDIFLKTGTK